MKNSLISFKKVTVRLNGRDILKNITWIVRRGQSWAILGLNGVGKSTLVKTIFDDTLIKTGTKTCIYAKDDIGYVAFELEKIIHTSPPFHNIATKLHLKEKPGTPLTSFSTGEMKKLLLSRALAKKPKLLILDEPFNGLDKKSRKEIMAILTSLIKKIQIIQVAHREDEIMKGITQALVLQDGKIILQGEKDKVLKEYQRKSHASGLKRPTTRAGKSLAAIPDPIINMKNVNVRYDDKIVLNNLNWTIRRGENWAIIGPNGAGKTTLLRLITGDNSQAYGQDISLFGKKKGSGETLWEVKKFIAEVSGDMQFRFQKNITVQEVVVSGFFDSIGLFRQANEKKWQEAVKWLKLLGLHDLQDRTFTSLSQGQQRMVLIARAMVKSPLLLLLDEVTDGLDIKNRKKVLALIQWIGTHTFTHLIFVTHHEDEIPKCIENILSL